MSYYSNVHARRSTRNHFVEPPSILERILAALPGGLIVNLQKLWERQSYRNVVAQMLRLPTTLREAQKTFSPRKVVNVPHIIVLLWFIVLLWGERWVFQTSVADCDWKSWERWPQTSTPHHLIFLTDPQLVDPHTYTGRPWPLSTLTEMHTDNYMRRSYVQLQKLLHPDTIMFLGDLFDGGREWATRQGDTEDPDWLTQQRTGAERKVLSYWKKHYGEDFWLREYYRFSSIFFKHWNDGGSQPSPGQKGRKLISSLPGNHDLGFGAGIKIPVRNRFEAYFGHANRVDVIGNHTFVSVDSVSLGAAAESGTEEIYGPVNEFLTEVQQRKRRAVARELRQQSGGSGELVQAHGVTDLADADFSKLPSLDPGEGAPGFPTILLTHVPLYRDPGTPCGPMRERWPPTPPPKGQITPVNPDERNAIPVSRGFQYQNVLGEEESVRLIESIRDVVSVFSGDDHDYCEIVHSPSKNSVREITVKSMSWAMGIQRPGFLMLSMWNPIDANGVSLGTPTGHGAAAHTSTTLEPHLCLLPDQLSIFIRYLIVLCLSLVILIGRAVMVPYLQLTPFSPLPNYRESSNDFNLLPISNKREQTSDSQPSHHRISNASTSSTSSNGSLAPRSSAVRTRSISPAPNYGYGLPTSQNQSRYIPPQYINSGNNGIPVTGAESPPAWTEDESEEIGKEKGGRRRGYSVALGKTKVLSPLQTVVREAWTSIWRVAWLVIGWYIYLAWHG